MVNSLKRRVAALFVFGTAYKSMNKLMSMLSGVHSRSENCRMKLLLVMTPRGYFIRTSYTASPRPRHRQCQIRYGLLAEASFRAYVCKAGTAACKSDRGLARTRKQSFLLAATVGCKCGE